MIAFMDGFTDYTDLAQKYSVVSHAAIAAGAGRFGQNALDLLGAAGDGNTVTFSIPPSQSVVVGFAFQWNGKGVGAVRNLIGLVSNSVQFLSLAVDTGGHLSFWSIGGYPPGPATQLLQTATYILTANEWHYCEIRFVINPVTPSAGTLECRIDGGVIMSSSLVNTSSGTNGLVDSVLFGCFSNAPSNGLAYVSDVYAVVSVGTGSWPTSTAEYIGNTIEDSNGNIEYAIVLSGDHKTGSSPPAWATDAGQVTQDNNVTWTNIGPASQLALVNSYLGPIEVLTLLPTGNTNLQEGTSEAAAWAGSTAMAVGATIKDSNNNLQRVSGITGDAKTGGSAPTWATSPSSTTADSHVTWTCLGAFSTGAFDLVNEVPPDDDSSYRAKTAPGQTDLFTFPTVPTDDSIVGVGVWDRERTDGAGTTSMRIAARSGGTSGDNGIDLFISPQYIDYFADMSADPNTGVLWTLADLNAALSSATEGGFGVTRIE